MFIENTAAVEITMNAVKTEAVIFRDKFGVKQQDKVLCKQQSFDLRLKKLFQNEDIIEEYFALHYRTDFTFKKHMLVVEIDEKEIQIIKKEDKKNQKNLITTFRINPDKKGFNDYEKFGRVSTYIAESTKKQTEKSTKQSLMMVFQKDCQNQNLSQTTQ